MTDNRMKQEKWDEKKRVYISLLIALIALVCASAASVAWFTIADFTRVRSINMEVTSGINLRFDLEKHESFDDYVKTLTFESIAERIQQEKNFDMRVVPLEPVTTEDYKKFTFEHGEVVESESGAYLEFTLHFIAASDMLVHLTSAHSENKKDGTAILSDNEALPAAMRISFTAGDSTWVYDPGMEPVSEQKGNVQIFGLAPSDRMVYDDSNALFYLKKDIDMPVIVHVWLEGADEDCTDKLRGADYSIRLRFAGTDSENNLLDGRENTDQETDGEQ